MKLFGKKKDPYAVGLGKRIYNARASYVLMAPFLLLFLVFVVILFIRRILCFF